MSDGHADVAEGKRCADATLSWEQTLEALLELVDAPAEIDVHIDGGPECRLSGPIRRVIVDEFVELGFSELASVHAGADGVPRLFFAKEQFQSAAWTDELRTTLTITLGGGGVSIEDRSPAKLALTWERRLGEALLEPDVEYRAGRLALLGAMAYSASQRASDQFVAGKLAAIAEVLGDYCVELVDSDDERETQ